MGMQSEIHWLGIGTHGMQSEIQRDGNRNSRLHPEIHWLGIGTHGMHSEIHWLGIGTHGNAF